MKTIGMIGGMSWESTLTYYRLINETVNRQLGGFHSARCLLYSVDFDEIDRYQKNGEWERAGAVVAFAASRLEAAGADFILICCNTMHKVIAQIEAGISIPVLHIAEATADEMESRGIRCAALLGTRYTMTQDFYTAVFVRRGIDILVPDTEDIEIVNAVIYDELCRGVVSNQSRAEYVRIVEKLMRQGAQGVILGCTEIGLLLRSADVTIPVFDTAIIHATRAAMMAIGK